MLQMSPTGKILSGVKIGLRKATYYALGIAFVAVIFTQVIVRFLLWPILPHYQSEITQYLSSTLQVEVQVDDLQTSWQDFYPALVINGLRMTRSVMADSPLNNVDLSAPKSAADIGNLAPQLLLDIPKIEGVIHWRSIWHLTPHFADLKIAGAKVSVHRNSVGIWQIAGISMRPKATTTDPISWMMQEGHLHIKDVLFDITDQFEKTSYSKVILEDFSLKNDGLSHTFNLKVFADALQGNLQASGDFKHQLGRQVSHLKNWQGHFKWALDCGNIKPFLNLLHSKVQGDIGALKFQGEFDLMLGGLTQGTTALEAQNIRLYWPNSKNKLSLNHLATEIIHTVKNQQQVLHAQKLEWRNTDKAYPDVALADVKFQFEVPNQLTEFKHLSITAPNLYLEQINQLAIHLPLPAKWLDTLNAISVRGQIQNLEATYHHQPTLLEKFKLKGEQLPQFVFKGLLKEVGWSESHLKLPGIQNLSGEFSGTNTSGQFVINSPELKIQASQFILEKNLHFDLAKGVVEWRTRQNVIDFGLADLQLTNKNIQLSGSMNYLMAAKDGLDDLKLNLHLGKTDIAYLLNTLPTSLPKNTLNYLQGTFVSGTLEGADVSIQGPPSKIPFSKKFPGKLVVDAQFKDLTYRPIPKNKDLPGEWLPFEKMDAILTIQNEKLLVKIASGSYNNLLVKDLEVGLNLSQQPMELRVNGNFQGKAADLATYFANSPVGIQHKELIDRTKISGDANVKLALLQKLNLKEKSVLQVNISLANNQIQLNQLPVANISNAAFLFDQSGLKNANLTGNWLDGPIAIKTGANQLIEFSGNVESSKLAELLGSEVPVLSKSVKNQVKGSLLFQGNFSNQLDGMTSNLNLDFRQVQMDLPEPLNKVSGTPLLGNLKLFSFQGNKNWQFKLDNLIQSQGLYRDKEGYSHAIAIGNAALPKLNLGTQINLDMPHLNLDRWNRMLDKPAKVVTLDQAKSLSKGLPDIVVNAKVNQLTLANKTVENLALEANHFDNTWRGSVTSSLATGTLEWLESSKLHPAGLLKAKFSKLTIPNSEADAPVTKSIENSKEPMPELDIQIDRFSLDKKFLGELRIIAISQGNKWVLNNLTIKHPLGQMTATGQWDLVEGNTSNTRSKTSLDFDVTSSNIGELLKSLGYVEAVTNGKGDLSGKISWDGAPYAFNKDSLNGDLKFTVNDGKILQVDAGAAKLLGILSLQGLFKFATLNFSGSLGEVVTSGTSFDKISASAAMRSGNIRTNDFEMVTTPARIAMSGLISLNQETQDIRVIIYPRVNLGSAGLAAFYFASPIVGLGAMVGQYLLSSGVNNALQSDYLIQGSWKNPEIIPLDQNGKPLSDEALKTIRQRNILNEKPGKKSGSNFSLPFIGQGKP